MIPIQEATIDVFLGHDQDPAPNDTPDLTIPPGDIQTAEISARTDEVMDEASITLWNHDGQYTELNEITAGDRIVFRAPLGEKVPYGNGWYGGGIYGGVRPFSWTGRILDVEGERETFTRGTLDLEVGEYVGSVLTSRKITNSYVDEDVGAIIRDIVERKAPEVDASAVPDLGVSTDIKYNSRGCWDAVLMLAARADATVIPDGMRLQVNRLPELPFAGHVGKQDYFTPLTVNTSDNIKNVIRINSGENRKVEAEQPAVDPSNTKRVTETDRIAYRLRARKAEIHSIELWVERIENGEDSTASDTEPGDELTVRLQADEGGAPIAPADNDSDIASTHWDYDNLPDSGWRDFFFDDHTLPDRDPWLLIETDGETGHNIGRNSAGDLSYVSYYPHPLSFEVQDNDSVRKYGPREKQIERGTLKTLTATRDVAESELARRAYPEKTVEFDVQSGGGHFLAPGDRIELTVPGSNTPGEFIVSEVQNTWDSESTMLQTTITATWRKGILAPQ